MYREAHRPTFCEYLYLWSLWYTALLPISNKPCGRRVLKMLAEEWDGCGPTLSGFESGIYLDRDKWRPRLTKVCRTQKDLEEERELVQRMQIVGSFVHVHQSFSILRSPFTTLRSTNRLRYFLQVPMNISSTETERCSWLLWDDKRLGSLLFYLWIFEEKWTALSCRFKSQINYYNFNQLQIQCPSTPLNTIKPYTNSLLPNSLNLIYNYQIDLYCYLIICFIRTILKSLKAIRTHKVNKYIKKRNGETSTNKTLAT